MEEFEKTGVWWLPENSDDKVAGTLKFSPTTGAKLELVGYFMNHQHGDHYCDIILGSAGTHLLTLYNCILSGQKVNSPGITATTYSALYVLDGYHFSSKEEIVFQVLSINYSYLEDWLDFRTFTYTSDDNIPQITYKRPDKIQAHVNDLEISLRYSPMASLTIREANLRVTAYVTVKLQAYQSVEHFLSTVFYYIQNFLSLGIGQAVYPLKVTGRMQPTEPEVTIFYLISGFTDASRTRTPSDMLFMFNDIVDEFEKSLNNWFDKADRLDPVYDLYFGILYTPEMYTQVQFILLAQALEAYHRRMYGGVFMTPEEYAPVYEALVGAIPTGVEKAHRDSLKGRIKYGYEYSFYKRLRRLLEEVLSGHESILDKLVGDREQFALKVKDTRNYLTHYDDDPNAQPIKNSDELFDYVQRMKLLLQMCFLHELGIPTDQIAVLIARNRLFGHWMGQPI